MENAKSPRKFDENPEEGKQAIQRIMDNCGMGRPGDNWQYRRSRRKYTNEIISLFFELFLFFLTVSLNCL